MKIRTGFVSNSSSSSFVCCICGETQSGWDLSFHDIDAFSCANGHEMCQEHAIKDLTTNGDSEDEDNKLDLYEINPECCPVCMYQEFDYDDARRYLKKEYKISEDVVFQEIKKINKRRKKLHSEEYVKYVFEKVGLTDDTFLAKIKDQFPIYKDYLCYKKDK